MCGIVGYIGTKDAKEIILHGLEKLEYRGYDSAGLAIMSEGGVKVFKDAGRIQNLRDIVDTTTTTQGIGHTRWATHGVPNRVNSHPHQCTGKRFTLVHNGVIENYTALKDEYLSKIDFVSETDTEIIVQLIEHFVDKLDTVGNAIRVVMDLLKGSYALAILDSENPDKIYCAKNKSPLLIGVGDGFNMIGSDAMAMIKETSEFIEINDKEFVVLTRDEILIKKISGRVVNRGSYIAELDLSDIEKGPYPHYMIKEIEEQPSVIRRIINKYQDDGALYIDPIILNEIKSSDRLHIIAAGTSYHSGLVSKQILEEVAKIPTEVHIASEFVYNTPLIQGNPLFIFVSQSGETADLRACLVKLKKLGRRTLTLTNVPASTLSRETDNTLLLHAGTEIAVASTKAFVAQLTVFSIIATLVGGNTDVDIQFELSKVANIVEMMCDKKHLYEELATEFFTDKQHAFYIGRGIDSYVGLEAALKLKEISYIHTEGFAAGELKHGTIALIEDGTPVIAIISQDKTNLNTRGNIKEVEARGAKVLSISANDFSTDSDHIVFDNVYKYLTPIVATIPTQYLAYYAALHRDLDIDKPRNLAKSVTVE